MTTKNLYVQHRSFISAIDFIGVPTSVHKVLKDKNMVQDLNEEKKAPKTIGTWEIVEKLNDKTTVGC